MMFASKMRLKRLHNTLTDQRLDTIEKNIETIQTSAKSTANIYHRMMIDDWSKELVLTNYGTKNGFIKKIAEAAKTGIATVESVDYETNSIRITRLTAAQINVYLDIDITDKKGHTLEFGFTCNEVTGSNNWGYNAYAPAAITWSWINKSINTRQKSSYIETVPCRGYYVAQIDELYHLKKVDTKIPKKKNGQ